MKTSPILLLWILAAAMLLSCNNDQAKNKTKKQKPVSIKELPVTCFEQEKAHIDGESEDPIRIKTCTWGPYNVVATGSADYKGRYSYEYELFRTENNQRKAIKNSVLFNSKLPELEQKINSEIKNELRAMRADRESAECLSGVKDRNYSIDQMKILFLHENEMSFKVDFGLEGACFAVDGVIVSMKLNEIKEFLK